ncbi:ABC transporter permease [Pseudonocardia oroxyli]|uniref:Peptide/nickel transport system permease protein n=1 Tax=Pseudonocardia oroxyli TaxID=366584 RepID=A0A1G7DR84_PSEOR|nr:ABC transporter permease [Pseudonocardia oroxyli]SDE53686.1 peptide/nickel transport system permease protein [Pseudonocardia oroxyli]
MTATLDRPAYATSVAVPVPRRRRFALLRLLGRTIGVTVPVFLLATLVTFLLGAFSGLSPAGQLLGDAATPADVARVNAELGLDRPVLVQYVDWLGHVVRGDLGTSWLNGVSVTEQIGQRLEVSLSVAGFALVIGVVVGTALGVLAAVRQGSWTDRAVTAFCTLISTLPPFVVSIGLIVVFCVLFPLFPSAGYVSPTENLSAWLTLITLPAVALSLDAVSDIARQLRTGLVAAQRENYVVGLVVRGLPPRRILWRHVLRNGSGPALSVLGLRVPMLIGGAVVTESIFGMAGFGRFAADGAVRGDVPVVQGTLVVAIVVVLLFNLLVNAALVRLRPAAQRGF